VNAGFNHANKNFFTNWLLGLRHNQLNSYLEFKFGKQETNNNYDKLVYFSTDAKVNNDFQVYADATYDFNPTEQDSFKKKVQAAKNSSKPAPVPVSLNYTLVTELNAGNNTRLKTKVIFIFLK
jgi:hypothetical protein